jgi:tetratricopeptide (TPR) repeat protein
LIDPFFTSVVMQVRQGLNSGVMIKFGASMQEPTKKDNQSATGGSMIETYEIARRTSPADLKTWEAVQSVFSGNMDQARATLQKVIKDYPTYGEAQRLAAVLFNGKDIKKAQALLEAAVKADPNCISCWRSLGDVQYKLGQYTDAIKSYDRLLQMKPDYGLIIGRKAESFGALGLKLLSSENNEKTMDAAKHALTNALRLRPGVEQFYTNLGAAYYFRGEFDENIDLLMIARKLRPDHARIYYNLGHAYRHKGDRQRAIEAYQKYVDLGEKGEEARVEKARQFIKELSN